MFDCCFHLSNKMLFHDMFAVFDVADRLCQQFSELHKIKIKVTKSFISQDGLYAVLFVKVKKKDINKFLMKVIKEMPNAALLRGYTGYLDNLNLFRNDLKKKTKNSFV